MIIKFTKNTRTNRKGQVIKGDYKILIHQVKSGNAVVSDEYELKQFIDSLPKPKVKEPKRTPVPRVEKEIPSINQEEECIPCKKKRDARKNKSNPSS